jgi:hypothetical protein
MPDLRSLPAPRCGGIHKSYGADNILDSRFRGNDGN